MDVVRCFAQGTLFSFHPLALLLRPALLLPTTLPTRFALQLLAEHSTEPDHDPYHPLSKRSHSILNIFKEGKPGVGRRCHRESCRKTGLLALGVHFLLLLRL